MKIIFIGVCDFLKHVGFIYKNLIYKNKHLDINIVQGSIKQQEVGENEIAPRARSHFSPLKPKTRCYFECSRRRNEKSHVTSTKCIKGNEESLAEFFYLKQSQMQIRRSEESLDSPET